MITKETGISIELAMTVGSFVVMVIFNIFFLRHNVKKIEEDLSDVNTSILETIDSEKKNMRSHVEEQIDKINTLAEQTKLLIDQRIDHMENKIKEIEEKHKQDIESIKNSKNSIAERLFDKTDTIREDLNKAMLNIERLHTFTNNDNKRIRETISDLKEHVHKVENIIFKYLTNRPDK